MDEKVIAEEQWLKELFEKSIDIEDIHIYCSPAM